VLALSLACQGDDWIVGGELPREMGTGPGGAGAQLIEDPDACAAVADEIERRRAAFSVPATLAPEHVGRWRGQLRGTTAAEGFPSRDVELRIDANGSGTLRFDAPTLDAGSDDPERGYLCSAGSSGVVCGSVSGFVGGFEYPTEALQSRDRVLSFQLVTADPWGSWCARQTPVRREDTRQGCGFDFGVLPEGTSTWSAAGCSRTRTEGTEAIDCALMYALEFCDCARDGCFASFEGPLEVGLELAEDGASLHGSLWYDELNAAPIDLSRTP
jgi:hypothetical protein